MLLLRCPLQLQGTKPKVTMKLCIVVGARPNFIKAAPIITAIKKYQKKYPDLTYFLIHTGQHYDENMSEVFLS